MKLESQTARANTVRMGSKFLASVKYKRTNVFCFKNRYTEVLMLMVKTDLANPGKWSPSQFAEKVAGQVGDTWAELGTVELSG